MLDKNGQAGTEIEVVMSADVVTKAEKLVLEWEDQGEIAIYLVRDLFRLFAKNYPPFPESLTVGEEPDSELL